MLLLSGNRLHLQDKPSLLPLSPLEISLFLQPTSQRADLGYRAGSTLPVVCSGREQALEA